MQKPQVVNFALAYNIFILLSQVIAFACIVTVVLTNSGSEVFEADAFVLWFYIGILGFAFFIQFVFIALLFVRNKWAFYIQVINFALGCSSIFTLVPCVFLIINWFKDDVKEYYGVEIG